MTSNKNETHYSGQIDPEQPNQPNGGENEATALRPSFVNSPFPDEDYHLTTSNLCKAIMTITDGVCELIEDVRVSVESPDKTVKIHYLEWAIERLWQIRSISEIINERLQSEDV